MFPREFSYVAAETLDDALAVLGDNEDVKVMAGGMSLLPLMKLRLFSPALVVDIGRIAGLDEIVDTGDAISIGPMVRHKATAGDPLIREHAPALADAAAWTGDVQVRNRGTTCGSVAHVDVAADQPAAALALGATMVARSRNGVRHIASDEFFVDTLTSALEPDELLVELRIPKRQQGEGSAYDKLGRRGGRSDYAVAGASAWVRLEGDGVAAARVALTGLSTKPVLARGVMEDVTGKEASEEVVAAASLRAAEGITVLEDLFGSQEYKAHLASVYARRALLQAIEAARSDG